MKRLIHTGLAALAASAAGAAHAQQSPPPPPAQAPATTELSEEEQSNEIVVLAQPGDQVRIDRRTYTLREDASAQSMNMFDVLGRIPSVSVAPSGEITLLGASNVTIQINGQPVPGANLEQVLRGLPGNQVERIEVITNPSAQYSADTSGGIINIITRNRFQSGFNGSLQTALDSMGNYHLGFAPSWSRGPWSLSGQAGTYGGENENNLHRERQDLPAGPLTTEEGARTFDYQGWYASQMQVGYNPNPHRRMSLSFDGGEFNFEQGQRSLLSDTGGSIAERASDTEASHRNRQVTFNFQQDGDQPRELIKFNAALSHFESAFNTLFSSTPTVGVASQYATGSEQSIDGVSLKFDIEQPFGEERFLTLGASYDQSDQDIGNSLALVSGPGPTPYDANLAGISENLAAYATYQFATGDWTWLPGLRVEAYRREVAAGGLETDSDDTRFFPTIHIRRSLTEHIDLDLSYTSRIQRPGFQQLDPSLRFIDVNRAFGGNPNLEPTTVDAYEANFVYQRNGASFSVTAFDRISDDVVSQFTDVVGGVIVTRPVNAGTSEQRGLQVLLRGPIGRHWRYSLSGNALSRAFDYLNSSGTLSRRDELEYDGIAQLDWRDVDQNAVGADQFQLELRFQGPRHGLQTATDEFVMTNFTWRRRVTPKLQAVFTVQDIFDSTDQVSEVTTDDYFERTEFESAGTRFRLALTYQFGSGPQRPMQDQQPGPPPTPF
ncbi:TonB-dependent receptor plug domain-containing protein [Terricaulis sp.]|uniref:TonB-dependent receptor plug domain-containing protein n=1 Tax=Terricaulis sp. TaxID=2768686 RepID=UPI0037836CBD